MTLRKASTAALTALMLIPGAAYAQVNLILDNATNTGAQTQLDINHSYFWQFGYSGSSSTQFNPIQVSFGMKIGPSTSASSYALLRLWAADTTTGLNTALIAEEKVFGNDARWGSSGFPTTWFTLNDPGAPGTAYNLPSLFNITFESDSPDAASTSWLFKDNPNWVILDGSVAYSPVTFIGTSTGANGGLTSGTTGGGTTSGGTTTGGGTTTTTGGGTTTTGGGTTTTGGGGAAVPEPGEWAAMAIFGTTLGGLVLRNRRKGSIAN